jgi:hypothetical protein
MNKRYFLSDRAGHDRSAKNPGRSARRELRGSLEDRDCRLRHRHTPHLTKSSDGAELLRCVAHSVRWARLGTRGDFNQIRSLMTSGNHRTAVAASHRSVYSGRPLYRHSSERDCGGIPLPGTGAVVCRSRPRHFLSQADRQARHKKRQTPAPIPPRLLCAHRALKRAKTDRRLLR